MTTRDPHGYIAAAMPLLRLLGIARRQPRPREALAIRAGIHFARNPIRGSLVEYRARRRLEELFAHAFIRTRLSESRKRREAMRRHPSFSAAARRQS